MRNRIWPAATILCVAAVAVLSGAAEPQDQRAAKAKDGPSRAELEQRFAESLRDVVFLGQWRETALDEGDAKRRLGAARDERYGIQRAVKDDGDYWIVTARLQFGETDALLPVRVKVLWAGDTPVITLDDVSIPQIGTYSARVVIHGGFYSGVWSGGGHGGVMAGQIVPASAAQRSSTSDDD